MEAIAPSAVQDERARILLLTSGHGTKGSKANFRYVSNLPVPAQGRKGVDERRTGPISSSRHWRGSLRTAANQSVSAVSDQPGQVEQRDQEIVERPC